MSEHRLGLSCQDIENKLSDVSVENAALRARNQRQAAIIERCPTCTLEALRPGDERPLAKLMEDERNKALAQVEELGKALTTEREVSAEMRREGQRQRERAERAEKQAEELKRERTHRIEEAQKVGVAYRERAERAEKQLQMLADLRAETDRVCDMEARLAKMVEMLTQWIPPHSAACCMPSPETGKFPDGPLKPDWCRCASLAKQSRAAIHAARTEAPEKARPDEDGHCTRCGLEWKNMTEVPHECPPGFAARAEAPEPCECEGCQTRGPCDRGKAPEKPKLCMSPDCHLIREHTSEECGR